VIKQAKKSAKIPGFTPEADFAAEQGHSLRTQRKKRQLGDCPAYIIVNRRAHYDDEDKRRYYQSKRIVPPRSGQAAA
jgi:hypothetical protein